MAHLEGARLESILKRYAAFEQKIQKHISEQLGQFCAACEGGCCTPTICRESKESLFLIKLRGAYQPDVRYGKVKGWQRSAGCALSVGRPPICYEFICNEIERVYADPLERYLVKVLCRLVTHVGKRLDGRMHIVEMSDEESLQEIRLPSFRQQLQEADAAFRIIRAHRSGKSVDPVDMNVLSKICQVPPSLHGDWRKRARGRRQSRY